MYAQHTTIRVPAAFGTAFSQLMECDFLPCARRRPGLIAAYLLADPEDRSRHLLVQLWESVDLAESFARTGALAECISHLKRYARLIRVECRGYHVTAAAALPARAAVAH
jgi:hypothetical protein